MKKVIILAFIATLCMTSWSVFSKSEESPQNNSAVSLMNVEAITRTELPSADITCGKNSGRCWIRSNSGFCVWTGYTVDYCF